MNSAIGPRIYCLLLRFSILGWSANSAVGPSKKTQNAKSLLGKRTLSVFLVKIIFVNLFYYSAYFDTIYRSHYTILANFYLYVQYF